MGMGIVTVEPLAQEIARARLAIVAQTAALHPGGVIQESTQIAQRGLAQTANPEAGMTMEVQHVQNANLDTTLWEGSPFAPLANRAVSHWRIRHLRAQNVLLANLGNQWGSANATRAQLGELQLPPRTARTALWDASQVATVL